MIVDYFVLRLNNVNDKSEAWLSSRAFDFGALGMSEALAFQQPEGEEDVFVSLPATRAVDIFFAQSPAPEFLDHLRAQFPEVRFTLTGELNKDWLAEWKKGFEPFALTRDHWVVPSWCQPPPQASFSIRIDPGMAFGTGTHETTRLVAEELEHLGPRASLLDVGTGTGILAVLACQMGFSEVHATEIETDSRRVAHENFGLNQVDVQLTEQQVEDLRTQYAVVVANIIDGVLVRIQDALKTRVQPGGHLVVSGIIKEREQDFLNGFHLPAGKSWRRRERGDWLLFTVQL